MIPLQQIETVLATTTFTEWQGELFSGRDEYVCFAHIAYWITVKNGRRWILQAAASIVISGLERMQNTPVQLADYRQKIGIESLREYLSTQTTSRTGLKGHRGYFRIIKLEAYTP